MTTEFEFARKLMLAHYGQDFLDELLSDNADEAENAANEFRDILYHQGDIYPESLDAVPDLVGALNAASPIVKRELIYILGGIATAEHAPRGDKEILIPRSTICVLEHWDQIAAYLFDEDEDVRLATLITLTDLARINLPGMSFRQTPLFVGALPDGVDARDLEQHLLRAIAASEAEFDEAWRQNCNVARAYLAFEPPQGDVHPFWAMLDRH